MLAVPESASCEKDWQVSVAVATSVPEVGRHDDGGAVEERGVAFRGIVEMGEQDVQFVEEGTFDPFELGDVALILTMVREIVVADVHARNGDSILSEIAESDHAGAVGLEGEMGQVTDAAHVGDDLVCGERSGRFRIHLWFGLMDPFLRFHESPLGCADGLEVLVQLVFIAFREAVLQAACFAEHMVEDTFSAPDVIDDLGLVCGSLISEKFCKSICDGPLRWHHAPAIGPTEVIGPGTQSDRVEACVLSERICDKLVE